MKCISITLKWISQKYIISSYKKDLSTILGHEAGPLESRRNRLFFDAPDLWDILLPTGLRYDMTAKQPITMDDIAKLARVSKPTVSRALSDSPLVKQDTKDHVVSVARQHGYAVNRNAQKLRHKRTNTVAVSLDFRSHQQNHISDPFIFELLAGVSEALGDRSQDLLLCAPNHNDVDSFTHILSSKGADGLIVLGQGHREDMLGELAQSGAPFVVWGAGNYETPYCVVGSDNYLGGTLAGKYLLEHNRSKFLFVGDTSFREIYQRRAGLQKVVEEFGNNVSFYDVVLSNFSFESAFEAATNFLAVTRELPDAVFASDSRPGVDPPDICPAVSLSPEG